MLDSNRMEYPRFGRVIQATLPGVLLVEGLGLGKVTGGM